MKKKIFNLCFVVMLIAFMTPVVYADNAFNNEYVMCGSTSFPAPIATITRTTILLLQILIPVGMIVMGSIDMAKSVISKNDDSIAKARNHFITRLIGGAATFFVFAIVKFIIGLTVDESDPDGFGNCLDCLINSESHCNGQGQSPFDINKK